MNAKEKAWRLAEQVAWRCAELLSVQAECTLGAAKEIVLRHIEEAQAPLLARVAELEAENAALKARLEAAYERVGAQSELLSKRAERPDARD